MTKNLFKKLIIIFFLIYSSALAEISYREILDNPTDLELNLNYAKQQEKVELAVKKIIHGETINNKEAIANPDSLKFFENLSQLKL